MNHTLRSIIEAELEKAVLAEREACAKVLDAMADDAESEQEPTGYARYYREKAAAIRARGENATDNN